MISGFIIGIVASIILGFGVVAGVAVGLRSTAGLGYEPNVWQATKTGPNSATLNLSTYPDSMVCHADQGEPQIEWVTYCPSTNWELPPNSLITVAMYNNKPMSQINGDDAAHTFTIQSQPDEQKPLFVSVPLLGVPDNAPNLANGYPKPNVIEFQFHTGPAGHVYIWHCYVPCGNDRESPYGFSGPMTTTGYMAGTLTVTNY